MSQSIFVESYAAEDGAVYMGKLGQQSQALLDLIEYTVSEIWDANSAKILDESPGVYTIQPKHFDVDANGRGPEELQFGAKTMNIRFEPSGRTPGIDGCPQVNFEYFINFGDADQSAGSTSQRECFEREKGAFEPFARLQPKLERQLIQIRGNRHLKNERYHR
jgi:hypothetical protein